MPTYCFSTDEEMFRDDCEVADMDEARKYAEEELCLEDGQKFYVGLRKDVHPEMKLNADSIMERIGEQLYDDVGEISEDWPQATVEQIADLELRLQAVVRQWLVETKNTPTFWQVVGTQTFIAGEEPTQ